MYDAPSHYLQRSSGHRGRLPSLGGRLGEAVPGQGGGQAGGRAAAGGEKTVSALCVSRSVFLLALAERRR